jgi:hypothetical protein
LRCQLPPEQGAEMIHSIFQWCVQLLLGAGRVAGLSYEAVNVVIFVFVWPALTVGLLVALCWQRLLLKRLKKIVRAKAR